MVALLIELCATAIPIFSSDKNNLKIFGFLIVQLVSMFQGHAFSQ